MLTISEAMETNNEFASTSAHLITPPENTNDQAASIVRIMPFYLVFPKT